MTDSPLIPGSHSRPIAPSGQFAAEWYRYFRDLISYIRATEGNSDALSSIEERLAALEAANESPFEIIGRFSVLVQGSPSDGEVVLQLVGDDRSPPPTYYYGTNALEAKGFHPVAETIIQGDGITLTVNADGTTNIAHADTSSVADISANFTGGTVPDEISFTFDQFGHVLTRTITGRTLDHNDTGALQGGSATERYHFTSAEHTGLLPWATEDPADYALITQTITNGDTTHAPSGDAVFDALADKADTSQLANYLPLLGGTMGGNIGVGIDDFRIAANTSLGSDTRRIAILSGGAFSATRGAYVAVHGLNHATAPGQAQIIAASGSDCVLSGAATRPLQDNNATCGASSQRWSNAFSVAFRPGTGAPIWTSGSGTPEGAITAPVGSLYTRTNGGAGTTLYVKESGAGNTGWVAK